MLIRTRFTLVFAGLLAILTSSPLAPCAADSTVSRFVDLESGSPPASSDRPDLSVERAAGAPSSAGSEASPSSTGNGGYSIVPNAQIQYFIDRFTRERREAVGLWLDRSSRYLGMIREVLKSRGLPEELAFTAMIESGFNPVAVSRVGAAGLWQFMASTARRYGLRVDNWVDERLDPEKSTFAAATYLRDLYQQFGSWTLAQAAYNAGDLSVARAIRATGTKDFWALSRTRFLAQETKEFVPQIAAATLIGRDPVKYGFPASDTTFTSFETVTVPPSTDLRWLASTAGIWLDVLRSMNPTLVRGVTPPGAPYALRVPLGTGPAALAALDAPRPHLMPARGRGRRQPAIAHARKPAPPVVASARDLRVARAARVKPAITATNDVHVVRPRDTVTSIARRYGVSVGDLRRWNSLEKHGRIRPGDRLRVTEREPSVSAR